MKTDSDTTPLDQRFRAIGTQVRQRLANLLTDLSDPARVELIQRQADELAQVALLWPAAGPDEQIALKSRMDAALAVLYSLASAKTEETAAAIRGTVADVLTGVLQVAIKSLVTAIGV